MNQWQRWVQAPATNWLRRLMFQVHLWLGLAIGLYVLMISVSGSAIVLRPQFSRWFIPSEVASTAGEALQDEALRASVVAAYPDHEVLLVAPATRAGRATYVELARGGVETSRYFDQYAGVDLGDTFPWQMDTIEWLTDLHDELLLGRDGRTLNGFGGILFLVMTLSGLVLWWQGKRRWQEGLMLRRAGPRSFNWKLHSFLGFWSLWLMLAWGITAVYFAWPEPFDVVIDWIDRDLTDFDRPDGFLRFMIDLHFGRFRGLFWANLLWIVLGLLPAVLFITGLIVWYRRVIRGRPQ